MEAEETAPRPSPAQARLTSPVTMYFPSGEKARALRDFLGTRKESSLVPPRVTALSILPTPGPQGWRKAWRNEASSSYTASIACVLSMALRETEQEQRALPPSAPNPAGPGWRVRFLPPHLNMALKLGHRTQYRLGLTSEVVLMGGRR